MGATQSIPVTRPASAAAAASACALALALGFLVPDALALASDGTADSALAAPAADIALPDYTAALVRMIVTLLVMVAALLLLARYLPRWLAKTRHSASSGADIDIVSSRRLDPARSLLIVRAGGRTLLVGSGPQGLNLITDLTSTPSDRTHHVHTPSSSSSAHSPSPHPSQTSAPFGAALASLPIKEPAHARAEHADHHRG